MKTRISKKSDRIIVYAANLDDGTRRKLGTCLTDNPSRAAEMYESDCEVYEAIEWEWED